MAAKQQQRKESPTNPALATVREIQADGQADNDLRSFHPNGTRARELRQIELLTEIRDLLKAK